MIRVVVFFLCFFSAMLKAEPMYWMAQKGDLKLMLLGSVHVGDDSLYPLPDTVNQFLEQSDGLIIETDVRKSSGVNYPTSDIATRDVLSPTQQQQLSAIAKQFELDNKTLLDAPPWAAAISLQIKQLEYLGYRSDDGVDIRLVYQATVKGIPVLSLETMQFQINLLTSQPEGGKELLTSFIDEYERADTMIQCLLKSWKTGDLKSLERFSELAALSEEYENQFITQRNQDWANKLANRFITQSKGNYLVVVGMLHLVGQDNLITLLRQKGFVITKLSNEGNAQCSFG
ncbi:TraB/GumN family protein [Vibrio olivae]|uniref:TraB/GumN family protein n=1 Tax=Vibrio olivae TaxID=1243002 RepID=A0ABV5HL90_9VIBR